MSGSKKIIELGIQELALSGDGVGRYESKVCFVPFSVPGDRLRVRVTRDRKNFSRCRIIEIIEPGRGRRDPPCRYFYKCGGCAWQHMDEEVQLYAKAGILSGSLGIDAVDFTRSGPAFDYRQTARFNLSGSEDGSIMIGSRKPRSHETVDIVSCPVVKPEINSGLEVVRKLLAGAFTGEMELVLSSGSSGTAAVFYSTRALGPEFYRAMERLASAGIKSIILNVDDHRSVISRTGRLIVAGSDGHDLSVPADGFMQACRDTNLEIGSTMREWLEEHDFSGAMELYAGSANLTVSIAPFVKKTITAELDTHAAKAARENIDSRKIRGVTIYGMDALKAYVSYGRKTDLVVLDPPRDGNRDLARAISEGNHRAVVYVSCNPATLARDLKCLETGGYSMVRARGFDMFSQTAHMEAMVLLVRGG